MLYSFVSGTLHFRVSYLEIYNDNVHDLLSNMAASTKKQISSLPASRHTICEVRDRNIYYALFHIHLCIHYD